MKTLLYSSSVAALLIAIGACQSDNMHYEKISTDSGYQSRDGYAVGNDGSTVSNTSEGDLGPPRPVGNSGNSVAATDWPHERNNATPQAPIAATPVAPLDELFLVNATMGGMYEIESSQLALRKSESARVRELANKLINDHTSANNELKRIAQQKNVTLPTSLDPKHRDMISKLESLDKTNFDEEYLRQQAAAHRDAIQVFDDQARNGKDDQSKQFAGKTLPTLQAHLNSVEAPYNTASDK